MAQIRFLIAEDNASARGQLRLLLELEEERGVVGEEEEGWEGLDGEEAIPSPYVIRPHFFTKWLRKIPQWAKPPDFSSEYHLRHSLPNFRRVREFLPYPGWPLGPEDTASRSRRPNPLVQTPRCSPLARIFY